MLYYLFLCCIWKRLWELNKIQSEKRRIKREEENRRQLKVREANERYDKNNDIDNDNDNDVDVDYDENVDEDDYNEKQEFKRTTFPYPSMPFSTSNRAQSASVYVIYTYDVLNIFMYIYTANMNTMDIPLIGRPNGVLFDFATQIIHVLLIGIKFYPILIVADMDPYTVVYLAASIYMGAIWTLKLFTKGFCSRTEAFVKQTLKKITHEVGDKFKTSVDRRYNISNTVFGLFSDDPDPNARYVSILKNIVPSVFKEFFGKYDDSIQSKNIMMSMN